MRLTVGGMLTLALMPLAIALSGCGSSGVWDTANNVSDKFQDMMYDFNPFGTAKKPLPGERRAVFPEGVPGVQQGVPSELVRGNQQALEAAPPPEPQAPPAKSKSRKTASKTKAQSGTQSDAQPAEDEVWPPPPNR